jgi:hypothetical protein
MSTCSTRMAPWTCTATMPPWRQKGGGGLMPGGAGRRSSGYRCAGPSKVVAVTNTPHAMYACNVHARVVYDEVLLSGLSSKQYRNAYCSGSGALPLQPRAFRVLLNRQKFNPVQWRGGSGRSRGSPTSNAPIAAEMGGSHAWRCGPLVLWTSLCGPEQGSDRDLPRLTQCTRVHRTRVVYKKDNLAEWALNLCSGAACIQLKSAQGQCPLSHALSVSFSVVNP